MGSSMVSRWPVVVSALLDVDDVGGDGCLTRAALERLVAAGWAAYLEQCTTVDGAAAEVRVVHVL